MRALFFSHDRRGLGHIQRTTLLANMFVDSRSGSSAVIVTGCRVPALLKARPRLDFVRIPASPSEGAENATGLSHEDQLRLRSELLLATVKVYRPDVFLVGSAPLDNHDESESAICYVRSNLPRTAVILNLRDIPDDPSKAPGLWVDPSVEARLWANYDCIAIHGSRDIFDVTQEYSFSKRVAAKTVFCGYVPRSEASRAFSGRRVDRTKSVGWRIVVSVGGGCDGSPMVGHVLDALTGTSSPSEDQVTAILGPEMPAAEATELRRRYSAHSKISFETFVDPATAIFGQADVVIAMGGYNTLSELAALGKPTLVIPRESGSTEQLVRARRFAEMGIVRFLRITDATPSRVRDEIYALVEGRKAARHPLAYGSADKFAEMIDFALERRRESSCA